MTVTATIDHPALGLSRLATQYQQAPKLRAYLTQLLTQAQDIEQLFEAVAAIVDIDSAEGVQLDNLGELIGISRYILNTLPAQYFSFDGQPGAGRLGEEGLVDVGAAFYEEGALLTGTSILTDLQLRLYIRARIARNHSDGTLESVVNALQYIFVGAPVIVDDVEGMAFNLTIGKRLTYGEQVLLFLYDILPKPGGVRIGMREYFDPANVFGFDGFPWALTFGEETQWSNTDTPNTYDGTFNYDGLRDHSGFTRSRQFIGPPPVIGGVFAEESVVTV